MNLLLPAARWLSTMTSAIRFDAQSDYKGKWFLKESSLKLGGWLYIRVCLTPKPRIHVISQWNRIEWNRIEQTPPNLSLSLPLSPRKNAVFISFLADVNEQLTRRNLRDSGFILLPPPSEWYSPSWWESHGGRSPSWWGSHSGRVWSSRYIMSAGRKQGGRGEEMEVDRTTSTTDSNDPFPPTRLYFIKLPRTSKTAPQLGPSV